MNMITGEQDDDDSFITDIINEENDESQTNNNEASAESVTHNSGDGSILSETQPKLASRKEILAASIKRQSIETIYKNVVHSVKETLEENDIVDIELTFKASSVHKGIPIISRSQDSSIVEIRLATRISGSPSPRSKEIQKS